MDAAAVPGEHATTLPHRTSGPPTPEAECSETPSAGSRETVLRVVALLAPALLVALVAWLGFGSYEQLMLALDRASAQGPCRGPDGVRPLCDFANYYYPQGRALQLSPAALPGFLYSAFFALGMRLLALFPYSVARLLWAAVVAGAALALLLAPLVRELRRSVGGCALYGTMMAGALPLWHDLAFGQTSALLTVLVALAFFAHARDRRARAGVLLGLAAAIKFYPALFAVYFVVRRDRRALLAFLATVLAGAAVLPALVLGEAGLLTFYRSLGTGIEYFARGTASNAFSGFIANAVTHLLADRIDPASVLYQAATVTGLAVAGYHVVLLWRLRRVGPATSARASLMLGLATIPFVVRTCWVHYFVFLPLLAGYVFEGARDQASSRWARWLCLPPAVLSVVLVSVPFFLVAGEGRYYEAALPFWATALLLPGLYVRIRAASDRAAGRVGPPRGDAVESRRSPCAP
jgi:hypothetical protein